MQYEETCMISERINALTRRKMTNSISDLLFNVILNLWFTRLFLANNDKINFSLKTVKVSPLYIDKVHCYYSIRKQKHLLKRDTTKKTTNVFYNKMVFHI